MSFFDPCDSNYTNVPGSARYNLLNGSGSAASKSGFNVPFFAPLIVFKNPKAAPFVKAARIIGYIIVALAIWRSGGGPLPF